MHSSRRSFRGGATVQARARERLPHGVRINNNVERGSWSQAHEGVSLRLRGLLPSATVVDVTTQPYPPSDVT